jgi:hypothetical protein
MLNLIAYYVEPDDIVIDLTTSTSISTILWSILPTY